MYSPCSHDARCLGRGLSRVNPPLRRRSARALASTIRRRSRGANRAGHAEASQMRSGARARACAPHSAMQASFVDIVGSFAGTSAHRRGNAWPSVVSTSAQRSAARPPSRAARPCWETFSAHVTVTVSMSRGGSLEQSLPANPPPIRALPQVKQVGGLCMQMKVSWCRRVDLPGVILVFSEISNALLTRTRSAALKQLNSCPLPSFLFRSPQRSAPLCVCFLAGVSSPTTPETRDASSRKFLLKLFFFFNPPAFP